MNRALLKVLIIDDDEDDFFITNSIIEELNSKNIVVDWTPSFVKGLESYKNDLHDIYIVDYLLGAKTGIDFLISVSAFENKKPIIMLTGKGDQNVDKQAMTFGAYDYLVKNDLTSSILERTMRYSLDRHAANKKLAESEAKYRSIFERSRDMIFITDPAGIFLNANESATRILGYSRSDLIGMNIISLISQNDQKKTLQYHIDNLMDISDLECTISSQNKQSKICLLSIIFQSDKENNTIIQGLIHDITKRRKAENDLATAEKLAVTGRVVRMIGHEIRNPLTNINLSLEQIEFETKENSELLMYIDIIRRNSERINSLITELLNSSKPAELKISKKSINTVVQQALELVADRIHLKNVNLVTRFSTDICDISIDDEKVKIAILNILVNAIESMPEKNGVLEVATRGEDDFCVLEISDNGCGIPADQMGKIFDPYFSNKQKGTGLGLSTTHNIIRSHNAIIDVSSEVDKGTTFVVKFNFN